MRNKRKLFRPDFLAQLVKESQMGVPTQTLINKHGIECSRPHLQRHIDYMICHHEKPVVMASLNPEWLDKYSSDRLQEQPDDWRYEGYFPWGEWHKR